MWAAAGVAGLLTIVTGLLPLHAAGDVTARVGPILNIGPLILLWGSLATLLWRERCKARGGQISAGQFAPLGVVGVPLVLGATLGVLALT